VSALQTSQWLMAVRCCRRKSLRSVAANLSSLRRLVQSAMAPRAGSVGEAGAPVTLVSRQINGSTDLAGQATSIWWVCEKPSTLVSGASRWVPPVASSASGGGGTGDTVTGTYSVTGGSTLYVYAGGDGTSGSGTHAGGYNGGANGGAAGSGRPASLGWMRRSWWLKPTSRWCHCC
jgi:hypothetical protein